MKEDDTNQMQFTIMELRIALEKGNKEAVEKAANKLRQLMRLSQN